MENTASFGFTAGPHGGVPEAFVQAALLAGGVGLWEWTIGDPGMALSPYLETLLGYPTRGFDGTKASFLARVNPLDLPRLELAIAHAVDGPDECDIEFRISDMHGGSRWFTARGRAMRDSSGAAVRLVGTMQEVPAAIVTERRMRQQQGALLALASRSPLADPSLDDLLAHIAEIAGSTLDVERTSVWLFTKDRARLVCRSLYVRGAGRRPAGAELEAAAFPRYVAALEQNRALDVADARNDPRTRELAPGYLAPLGITSMLEATVRMDDGALAGVVCHEHVGPIRQWLLHETGFAGSIADMVTRALTEDRRRRLTDALARSEERYRTYVSISTEAILRAEFNPPVAIDLPPAQQADQVAARAIIVECNPALARMLSVDSPEGLRGRAVASLLPDGVARRIADGWVRSGYRMSEQEFQITTSDSRVVWVLGSSAGVVENGLLKGMWSTWRDISVRKDALARLKHQARHDPLTGLPNRKWVAEQLNLRIAEAKEKGERLALLLMDLDHFKEINDCLGHHAGDQLLKLIGPRLKPLLESTGGEMARLGGDEFAIIVRHAGADEAILAGAIDLVAAVCEPYEVGELHLGIDASVGAAVFPTHAGDASSLLRCADVAMYEAKRQRSRATVYSRELDRHSPRRLALANALGAAIRAGELTVHYQPIVGLRERRLAGVEALARWDHPKYGVIHPEEFIPIAEMGDQIRHLTLYVLNEAARQWNAWEHAGLSTTISINLSTRVLVDRSFVGDVRRILGARRMRGGSIHFEITESAMFADPLRASEALAEFKGLGIGCSVDDFGMGFSSLSYLKQLPLATLKIDRSFVSQMATSERDASIVRSTIGLAHALGLKAVAEGVDTDELLAIAREMGCDDVQGHAIARPAEGLAILEWARASGWK